ncbi:MFS transporter [uncultured Gilvimarinus sp.]|uniref:MFS transporter n=1 Tax=uncultured Gilvimarinus sp. TaxID=1689143 RepID=UPI0030EF0E82
MSITATEQTPNAKQSTAKLSFWEKAGFGAGDLGFNFFWATWSSYLMIFYTDVFGISAAAVGTMMLLTRIVDAFTDPAMAAIADRTRSRWGKFRPYLLFGAIPMAGAAILTFTIPDISEGGKLIWAYATYTLMMLCYTILSIPYSALSGVMTGDSQQRTTLISFRFIGAFVGTMIVNWLTPDMVKWLGGDNEALGWQLTMGLYGVVAAVLFVVVFATTRERITPPEGQQTHFTSDIKDLIDNKPWLILFSLALIIMITIYLRGATGAYYFTYFVERPELIGPYLGLQSAALAIGAACTPLMTMYLGKKQLMVLLMSIVGILSILFFFIPKDMIWLMFAVNTIICFALGPKSPLAFSMYADTADYTEWKTGRRATAMTFAAATFSQKLGGAIASAVIGWTLGALGYVANQAQNDASQMGIVVLLTIVPGAVALIAAGVVSFYSLDEATMAQIQQDLADRKTPATP